MHFSASSQWSKICFGYQGIIFNGKKRPKIFTNRFGQAGGGYPPTPKAVSLTAFSQFFFTPRLSCQLIWYIYLKIPEYGNTFFGKCTAGMLVPPHPCLHCCVPPVSPIFPFHISSKTEIPTRRESKPLAPWVQTPGNKVFDQILSVYVVSRPHHIPKYEI